MGIGHLAGRTGIEPGGNGPDEIRKHRYPENEQQDTAYFEQDMCQGNPLGVPRRADTRHAGGDAGTDIGAENHRYAGIQRNQPLLGENDHDAGKSAAALNKCRKDSTGGNPQQRIFQPFHHLDKIRIGPEGLHGIAHQLHSEKQDAETENDIADITGVVTFSQHLQGVPDGNHQQSIIGEFERDELGGDGSADVRTQNHSQRVDETHQSRLYKTDQHDGGGAAGLDDACNKSPDDHPDHTVFRQRRKDGPHLVARCHLHPFTHLLHPVEKKGQPSEKPGNEEEP